MTRLTRLALAHPSIVMLLAVFVTVAGIVAARSMNQELVPDIEFPMATVLTIWPGASADEMTTSVTRPIEDELETIDDVDVVEVSSTTSESYSAVTVRAEYGTKQDELRDVIDKKLAAVDLPADAEEPEIVLINFDAIPVVSMSASGEMDTAELQRLVETDVVPELEKIDGVGSVSLYGEQADKIFVTLDPDKMAAEGVTIDAIQGVLQANNVSIPAGTLLVGGESVPLQVSNRFRSEDDLRALVLIPGAGGASGASESAGAQPAPAAASPAPTEVTASATAPKGPFPLPDALRDQGYETTDDLTPDLVRRLAEDDPDLLREVAAEIIAILPVGSIDALPADVVAALPNDIRADLEAAVGKAEATETAPTSAATTPRQVRVVVAGADDTVQTLADRYGADPEEIRRENALSGDEISAGTPIRVPLPAAGTALPPVWNAFGATNASDVTPDMIALALDAIPDAVNDLTGEQMLALSPEVVAVLPQALIDRQTADVRARLEVFRAVEPTAVAEPAAAPAPASSSAERAAVTLGDVATVERAAEDAVTLSRTNGQASVGLSVLKEQSANTVNVTNDVLDKIGEFEDTAGLEDLAFDVVFEQGSFIEESLSGVQREGVLGALFAILVILAFLGLSLRATLVTAISIPLSVVTALLLMRAQGLTLNLLTLSGLTIAIGRIVDDAIVVTENIFRHLQRGDRKEIAVLAGTREVATAITASTLVTVAVFLPLGLVGGIIRQFFLPFGLTATYALLASLLVAVTIVPLLARWLMSRSTVPQEHDTWLQRMYTPSLVWALDHRILTLVLATTFFLLSLIPLRFIATTFMPNFGEPTLSIEMAMVPGTDLATTDASARQVEALLMADEDIETVQATVGGSSTNSFAGSGGNDTAVASFIASFAESDEGFFDRFKDDSEKVDPDAVAERLRRQLPELAGDVPVTFTVSAQAMVGMGGNSYDLQILSDDETKLREANTIILSALKDPDNWTQESNALQDLFKDEDEEDAETDVPIINLESNLTAARPVLSIDVDPGKALARGLTTAQVGLAMRQVIDGASLGEVTLADDTDGATFEMLARYPADTIASVDALADFELNTASGPVRLGDIAAITKRPGPVQISRVDGKRAAILSGEITDDDTFGVAADADQIIEDLDLDDRFGEDLVEVGAGVESSQQQQGFSDMLAAVAISIVIVYLIMVFTFRSLVHPFTILFSLPFAASGAFIALALTGRALSVTSLIGLLMLVGIVVTNAIVLVDLVQQYRKQGKDARTALIEGGRTRLRPILMTAIATVLALTPQALELTGEGGLIASDLAITVIGGLLTSTFLTLIVVPVVYSLLDNLTRPGRSGEPDAEIVTPDVPTVPPETRVLATPVTPDVATSVIEPVPGATA